MAVLLAGAPSYVPLPIDRPMWTASSHRWTSGGLSWDLTGNRDGLSTSGISLMAGVRGLKMPPILNYRRKSASVPGSRWRGSTTDEREVFWPLQVFHQDSSYEWLKYNRQLWSTMRPDVTGTWSVTQPGDSSTEGETRYLDLRFDRTDDEGEDIDPTLMGWADYGIYLIAEQPYWYGTPIVRSWDQSGGLVNYYGGGAVGVPGYGPPFVTTSGRSLASATVTNPGDVAGLPTWVVYGPSTSVLLGVGDQLIDIPFTLTAGQWVRIDTARTDRRAMFGTGTPAPNTGTNRTRELGATTRFGEVPPGQSVPLSLTMTGTGFVEMQLVPLYYQAR